MMRTTHRGMDPLPGINPREFETAPDKELEAKFPWLKEAFSRLLMSSISPETRAIFDTYQMFEFPIAAAILVPGEDGELKIASFAPRNATNEHQSPFKHAEMWAIEMALGPTEKHLPTGAVLLSTVEPCAMCASGIVHAEASTVIYGATQDDLRGKSVKIGDEFKPFRCEPEGYSAAQFIQDRRSSIDVVGGYRRNEVLENMNVQ